MTWSPLDIVAAAVFAVWLLLSLLAQTSLLRLPLPVHVDFFRLIRRYDVFAPDPELRQVRVLMRGVPADSDRWTPVTLPTPTRPIRTFWNPTQAGEAAILRDCLALDSGTRIPAGLRAKAKERITNIASSRFRALGHQGRLELRVSLVMLEQDGSECERVIAQEIVP